MIQNKKIVITGASSGIGFEVMKRLAADGTNTILAVARHVDVLENAASNIIPFSADQSTKEGIDSVFEKAKEVLAQAGINILSETLEARSLEDFYFGLVGGN